jgi:hypothetical protein
MRLLVLFCFVFVFMIGGVLGTEGVIPGSYSVDFKPGLEKSFTFVFILDEDRALSIEGELAEFVSLDQEVAVNKEEVVVDLKLPRELELFGSEDIWVLAGGVRGLIRVRFPYPERFVGVELSAPNVNQGEGVDIGLDVSNLGVEDVSVKVDIEIYEWEESRGDLIEIFEFEGGLLNVSSSIDFAFILDSSNYSAGDYVVVARVDYGDDFIEEENVFRLGDFRVGILNYTNEFYGGKINRFEIEVENLWNDDMSEVYAGVRIVDSGEGFDSGIISLGAWEKNTLVGFFDAKKIEGDVDVELNLYYSDEGLSSSDIETIRLIFLEDTDWFFLFKFFLALCVAVFVLWRIGMVFNK